MEYSRPQRTDDLVKAFFKDQPAELLRRLDQQERRLLELKDRLPAAYLKAEQEAVERHRTLTLQLCRQINNFFNTDLN